jgi:hypothetical protein
VDGSSLPWARASNEKLVNLDAACSGWSEAERGFFDSDIPTLLNPEQVVGVAGFDLLAVGGAPCLLSEQDDWCVSREREEFDARLGGLLGF